MHTGGRAKADIDAGGVLPGYTGTLVRDGYAGYAHLTEAYHAWCGAHLLRDLRAIHQADPTGQLWAEAMATTLTQAKQAVAAAVATGAEGLDEQTLAGIRNHYRGALAKGVTDNHARAGPLAAEAATLARRFHDQETMILRFVVDFAVPFSNDRAAYCTSWGRFGAWGLFSWWLARVGGSIARGSDSFWQGPGEAGVVAAS
jgi:transposase